MFTVGGGPARAREGKVLVCAVAVLLARSALASGPTGAIFTTNPDGSAVNENTGYATKLEVYLDGGPGPHAPANAAGLDAGWYVFQVTDPAGKALLSSDPAICRVFEVSDAGVITRRVPPSESVPGTSLTTADCWTDDDPEGAAGASGKHDTNHDADHWATNGAIVVQLMPFADTPNPGGVYKAWARKFDRYVEEGDLQAAPESVGTCPGCSVPDPGFANAQADTKTDNFKVATTCIPPTVTVKKFHDENANGVFDEGTDAWVEGWQVDDADPEQLASTLYTEDTVQAQPSGTWCFTEDTPSCTTQTASLLDGTQTDPLAAKVCVAVGECSETAERHEIVYGNVGLSSIKLCKIYDTNRDGTVNAGEPAIQGWKMTLTGTVANGQAYGPVTQLTGADGCTTFTGLLPGSYVGTEVLAQNYFASGATTHAFTVESKLDATCETTNSYAWTFTNFCAPPVGFLTKGYWSNKNGVRELQSTAGNAAITYANGLDPFNDATAYWQLPFDGTWRKTGNTYFGTGKYGEISDYLVSSVSVEPQRFQLSQQLLAFIFNHRLRVGSDARVCLLPQGWSDGATAIGAAVAAWQSAGLSDDVQWITRLDAANNDKAVPCVSGTPCAVVYP